MAKKKHTYARARLKRRARRAETVERLAAKKAEAAAEAKTAKAKPSKAKPAEAEPAEAEPAEAATAEAKPAKRARKTAQG